MLSCVRQLVWCDVRMKVDNKVDTCDVGQFYDGTANLGL